MDHPMQSPKPKPPGPLPMGPGEYVPRRPMPRTDRRPLALEPEAAGEVVDEKARALLNFLATDIERLIYIIKFVGWTAAVIIAAVVVWVLAGGLAAVSI